MDYSVVIPVYNSTESLKELAQGLDVVFTQLNASYELIFVDDASPNKETWKTLEALREGKNNICIIQLMRNFGKQGALLCGFEQAQGKYIITMDDDLQHLPKDLPQLIKRKEHDVVIGYFSQKNHSFLKKILSNINNWFEGKLIGKPSHIKNSPYKLIKAEVIKSILKIKTANPSISALIFFTTRDVVMGEVTHNKRVYGSSGFTFLKMYKTFSNLIFNNSSFLLRIMAVIGISISGISFLLGFYFIIKKLTVGIPVPGWSSLITITLFLGGLILFSVGIVGEYLIRIINGIENKPAYLIRKKIGF